MLKKEIRNNNNYDGDNERKRKEPDGYEICKRDNYSIYFYFILYDIWVKKNK